MKCTPTQRVRKSPKKRLPGITQPPQPPVVLGEDQVSFGRHNKILKTEFKKSRRNEQVVSDLMDRTFPMRRKAVVEKCKDLSDLYKQFPFLQEANQVCL